MNTLTEIRDYVRNIILESSGTGVFTDDIIDLSINAESKMLFDGNQLNYVYEDFSAGATSIKIIGDIPSKGQITIGKDTINYSSVTDDGICYTLATTGVLINHKEGEGFVALGDQRSPTSESFGRKGYPEPVYFYTPPTLTEIQGTVLPGDYGRQLLGRKVAGMLLTSPGGNNADAITQLRIAEQALLTFTRSKQPRNIRQNSFQH